MQQNHMSSVFLHRDEGMLLECLGAKRGLVAGGRPKLASQVKAARSTCPVFEWDRGLNPILAQICVP